MGRTTRTTAWLGAVALVALVATACIPYKVDPAFGSGGKTDLPSANYAPLGWYAAADGGFYVQDGTPSHGIARYTPDGTLDPDFKVPTAIYGMTFAGQRPNGDLILVGAVVGPFSSLPAVLVMDRLTGRYTLNGVGTSTSWQWRTGDVAPGGRFAAASMTLSNRVTIQTFDTAAAPLISFNYTQSTELASACSSTSNAKLAMTIADDGTITLASQRCSGATPIGVEVARILPTGVLDTSYGGGDGRAVLAASDDGTTPATLRQVLASDDGSIAVLSTGGTLRRLAPDGTVDTTFGLVSVPATLGATPTSIVADTTGYAVSHAAPTGTCTTAPAKVMTIDRTGAFSDPFVAPFSVDGGYLSRHPDGRLLVAGTTGTEVDNGGTLSCGAPWTGHAARLATAF